MGAFDFARYIWPDADEGRQPQGVAGEIDPDYLPGLEALLPMDGVPEDIGPRRLVPTFAGNTLAISKGFVGRLFASGYVSLGDLFWSDSLTICVTFVANTIDTNPRGLVIKRNSSPTAGAATNEFALNLTTSGLQWVAWNSSEVAVLNITSSFVPLPGLEYTVVIIQRGNGKPCDMYIDEELVGQATQSGVMRNSTNVITIGDRSGNNNARYWAGYIGQVGLWSGALDAELARKLSGDPHRIVRPRSIIMAAFSGGGANLNAAASGTGQAAGSADLAAQVALAAIGVSAASGTAPASVAVPLSAAGIAVADGQGSPQATVSISAAGLAAAAGQAGLSADVLLAAAGAAQAASNADLAAQLNAAAAGAAESSGSANLSGGAPGALAAAGQAIADGAAVLSISVQLQATGASQASGTANGTASAPGALSAAGQATADGWASWSTLVTITAAGFVQAMGAGTFSVTVPLSASGQAIAGGTAAGTLQGLVRRYQLTAGNAKRVQASCSSQRSTQATATHRRLTNIQHEVRHA